MDFLQKIYGQPLHSPSELQLIFDAHQQVTFRKDEYILREGQVSNEYYCLEKGLVRTYVTDYHGDDITTGFIEENDIAIDVFSLFQRLPAKESMQALTDCTAWKMEFARFQELYLSIGAFSEWGRAWMSQSLFQLKQRSLTMITDSATERYLALQKHHPAILLHAPLKYIASYLGITDTSLSRIRKEVAKT